MIRIYLLSTLFFLICLVRISAQTENASNYGYLKNASDAIELALKSSADTIIIDAQERAWFIDPIKIKGLKNKVIIIEPTVELIAKKGAFNEKSDVLLEFIRCENIKIIGNGAKLCMNKDEYADGEWRHGISLRGCSDFLIQNIHIQDTGGDGIYISGYDAEKRSYSENIKIDRVTATNNKRQGISIISGKDISVTNSIFQNTFGTLPGAGVDLEPNSKLDRIQGIVFKNCIFRNNDHSGILLALGKLEKDSEPVSVSFEDCVLQNNHNPDNRYIASEIVFGAHKTSPVTGEVVFKNCIVENSKWGLLYSRKTNDAYHVTFKDCQARNICTDNSYPVIYLEVPDYKSGSFSMGGFTFDNFLLNYTTDVPIFQVRGSIWNTLAHVSDVNGKIVVSNPKKDYVDYIKYNPTSNINVGLDIQPRN